LNRFPFHSLGCPLVSFCPETALFRNLGVNLRI
jgi:hypothetical protein